MSKVGISSETECAATPQLAAAVLVIQSAPSKKKFELKFELIFYNRRQLFRVVCVGYFSEVFCPCTEKKRGVTIHPFWCSNRVYFNTPNIVSQYTKRGVYLHLYHTNTSVHYTSTVYFNTISTTIGVYCTATPELIAILCD